MVDTGGGKDFAGYHSEWNLGSPGGWYYQLMAQKLGEFLWERVRRITGLRLPLVFDHPALDSPPRFRDMLYRGHELRWGRGEKPGIALLAEKETLDSVLENRLMVEYLAGQPDTEAVLAAPGELEIAGEGRFRVRDTVVTMIFCDFNNKTIVELERSGEAGALSRAITGGLVINPRGMEPVGSKGIFEVASGPLGKQLSVSTTGRTPWTRRFGPRKTAGPDCSLIADLVEWTRANWRQLVLKPEHGYSGQGVFVGLCREDRDQCIRTALEHGAYIVQELIPTGLWAELYPELEPGENASIVLATRQTDFRCLISDAGLMGFVCRWGGIPTNVGMGGGTQAVALIDGDPGAAAKKILEAMERMSSENFRELVEEVKELTVSHGLNYLDGPIPQAMRPRIISFQQLEALCRYSTALWQDCVKLESWWRAGELGEYLTLEPEEERIARLQPWGGTPALLASDGLYSFGADLLGG
ncbi:MAG: hypothetical protein U9P14_09925 [Gemmatimonadota bacterium]|nr:hypothetical protein [Gemmatimonadota bacterium]